MITDSNNSSAWNVTWSVNRTEIEFKLDTGADVSVIPEHMLNSLKVDALLPASTTLTGAGNQPKCQFSQKSVKFLGHLIDRSGVHPDPDKVQAIIDMQPPTNVHEVHRFLGMVQQMGKFSPNLAEKTKPLSDFLRLKNQWAWTEHQQQAFEALKREN